jgi:hypothetical protein
LTPEVFASATAGEWQKMGRDTIEEIEEKMADLKARWPAHSVKPSMWQELEDLEEKLEKARKDSGDADASKSGPRKF